jgi:glutamate-1-semialdehyde aminotransferase
MTQISPEATPSLDSRAAAVIPGGVNSGERPVPGLECRLSWPSSALFVTCFLEGPVESYDDLLRNDVALFVGYRRELMRHGIFELPLNLKRSHFSYAHTEEDVDRLLEATETAVAAVLAGRA